jgi:uncharacterized protein YjdB
MKHSKLTLALMLGSFALILGNLSSIKDVKVDPLRHAKVRPLYTTSVTSEPKFSSQFQFNHVNRGTVWDNYRGDGVTVAIIDSGLNYQHEDFQGNVLDTSAYIDGTGNSVVTKTVASYGASIIDDPLDNGHGTNVAGTIGAMVNGIGSAGLAPNVNLMILKTNYYFTEINTAIRYAADNGADVINMSIGAYETTFVDGYGDTQTGISGASTYFQSAINYAYNKGVTLVAAAGNEATDMPSYPACNTNIIGVGALARNSSTTIAEYSNFNKSTTNNVDVVAPGSVYVANIDEKGTKPTSQYVETQGTSFASPMVAAGIALYIQANPYDTPAQIETALKNSCYDLGTPGVDNIFGYGRMDLTAFVDTIPVTGVSISPKTLNLSVGDTSMLSATITPSDATNKTHIFISNNDSVATVSDDGLVTAVGAGTTQIGVLTDDGSFEDYCTVTVTRPSGGVLLTSLEITNGDTMRLGISENKTLTLSMLPIGANTTDVTFSSSDNGIVSVDANGQVTGISEGTATITVTARNGSLSDTITITVGAMMSEIVDSITASNLGLSSSYKDYTYTSSLTDAVYKMWGYLNSSNMQMNASQNKGFIVSTSAGSVGSIEITWASNTSSARSIDIYASNTAYSSTATSTITASTKLTTIAYSASPVTYEFSGDYAYFAFVSTSGVIYLSNIDVTWLTSAVTPEPDPVVATLSSISVYNSPTKTTYTQGETLNLAGLEVLATYSDASVETVTTYTTSPANGTTLNTVGTQIVTISYTEGEITKTTTLTVEVEAAPVTPDPEPEPDPDPVDGPSEVTDGFMAKGWGGYTNNSFSATGTDRSGQGDNTGVTYAMRVFNGSTGALRGNQSSVSGNFSMRNTTTYDGYYISSISITVTSGTLTSSASRSVISYSKTAEVSATNESSLVSADTIGSSKSVLTWTVASAATEGYKYFCINNLQTSGTALSAASNSIQVTWVKADSGSTPDPDPVKTLTGINVYNSPTKTTYTQGEYLNLTGLEINATYSDASTSIVNGYTTSPTEGSQLNVVGTIPVTVTYAEGGITEITSFNITVNPALINLVSVVATPDTANLVIGETVQLSVTTNPTTVYPLATISYSSNNSGIASVNSSGLVTAVSAGSAVITVTATQNLIVVTDTVNLLIEEPGFEPVTTFIPISDTGDTGDGNYHLVKDVASLQYGDQIVIVGYNGSSSYAMSTTQNSNNRGQQSVTITAEETIIADTMSANVQVITLEEGYTVGGYALYTGAGYLYAASSGSNYLRTQTSKTTGNASFNITMNAVTGAITSCIAQGSYTRNNLRYNSSSSMFSCYSGGQNDIYFYRLAAGGLGSGPTDPIYNYDYLIDVLDGDYCTFTLEKLNEIESVYAAMTSTEKTEFDSATILGQDGKTYTGQEAYQEAMLRRNLMKVSAVGGGDVSFVSNDETTVIYVLLGVLALSLASIGSFFALKRKKSER